MKIVDEVSDGEESCLITMRVKTLLDPGVTGSVIWTCGKCKEDVWVSPGALEQLHKISLVVCLECLLEDEELMSNFKNVEIRVLRSTIKELLEELKERGEIR